MYVLCCCVSLHKAELWGLDPIEVIEVIGCGTLVGVHMRLQRIPVSVKKEILRGRGHADMLHRPTVRVR